MATEADETRDIPMSVKMRRVLDSVKRMSPSDRVQLLVKAGLMPESEAPEAVIRLSAAKEAPRKAKPHQSNVAKKATEQGST